MKPRIAVIGGGTAGLSFSCFIDTSKYEVSLFEKKNRLGSKLLVAGKGGFNLTHSESISKLINRYSPNNVLEKALNNFTNTDFTLFLKKINISTYVGSSKRIFPIKSIKPVEVVSAIETEILKNNANVNLNSKWIGLKKRNNKSILTFETNNHQYDEEFDYVIFALGGKSWAVTGSDGSWINNFKELKVDTHTFESSNSAMQVSWPLSILKLISGKPLKNLSVTINKTTIKGELMITNFGLEGTPIYTLNKEFRENDNQGIKTELFIDFKPNSSLKSLINKIDQPILKSWTKHLENNLKLSKTQMTLLKEFTSKDEFLSVDLITKKIKNFRIEILGLAPIEEAISSIGGISTEAVDENFELKQLTNVFVLGEMLDWDAPTGGYLIQACMSMGYHLAQHLNRVF
ncbi:MAG: TIGR03862 family flavoprotein [Crocinitomicaceae bacterium]